MSGRYITDPTDPQNWHVEASREGFVLVDGENRIADDRVWLDWHSAEAALRDIIREDIEARADDPTALTHGA